jgi:putative transposase
MARLPRLVVPGHLHLVLQRAAGEGVVFRDDVDFAAYRRALGPAAADHGVLLHAWALTASQVLLLVTPKDATGASRMLQAVGRRFGGAYNRRHQRTGALWEGRFRTTVVDPAYLVDATRYVEGAPVRLSASAAPGEYAWSSAAHHLGMRADPDIAEHPRFWLLGNTPFEREAAYRRLLDQPMPATLLERLDAAVTKGWALGDRAFVERLAVDAPRRVAPLARGRPRSIKTVPKNVRGSGRGT